MLTYHTYIHTGRRLQYGPIPVYMYCVILAGPILVSSVKIRYARNTAFLLLGYPLRSITRAPQLW